MFCLMDIAENNWSCDVKFIRSIDYILDDIVDRSVPFTAFVFSREAVVEFLDFTDLDTSLSIAWSRHGPHKKLIHQADVYDTQHFWVKKVLERPLTCLYTDPKWYYLYFGLLQWFMLSCLSCGCWHVAAI